MFTPPRFVVIDDNEQHLNAIASAVQAMGSACARVLYDAGTDVPAHLFRGARVIFTDLQLLDGAFTADFARHFAEIQRILGAVIQPESGPYLLIVWTNEPTRVSDLEDYLGRSLFPNSPHVRPVGILALSKTEYIDLATGSLRGAEGGLRSAILDHLRAKPAMASLVQWEVDVLSGASRVLGDIASSGSGSGAQTSTLPTLLRRLADEAFGRDNAGKDPRSAVHAALLPLLQDHLQNSVVTTPCECEWGKTFDDAPDLLPGLGRDQIAQLNTRLHVTAPSAAAPIAGSAWGAICELEDGFDWSEFGYASADEYLEMVVHRGIDITNWEQHREGVSFLQVRIGAACDYAQKPAGPVPYVLGAFLPDRGGSKQHMLARNSTNWLSPSLIIAGRVGQLFVNPRFVRTRSVATDDKAFPRSLPLPSKFSADDFVAVGRMKEQLLLELIGALSHHSSRPGIVQFRP